MASSTRRAPMQTRARASSQLRSSNANTGKPDVIASIFVRTAKKRQSTADIIPFASIMNMQRY